MYSEMPRALLVAGGIEYTVDAMLEVGGKLQRDTGSERCTYFEVSEVPNATRDVVMQMRH